MVRMAARVLVVEDDPAAAEMLSIALRQAGFETAVVSEGPKAMPAMRELKPDLVLLDLMLPGMSGIELDPAEPVREMMRLTSEARAYVTVC